MELAISINELNARIMSPKAMSLVSEFALVLFQINGTVIDVDSEAVLSHVLLHAKANQDRHLRKIFIMLRTELRQNIETAIPLRLTHPLVEKNQQLAKQT